MKREKDLDGPGAIGDDVAISVDGVSKKFCKSLKRSMIYGVSDVGKNLAGMRSGSGRLRPDEFWAVDDVSFRVKKGEIFGIIGSNGSGKSTMLKMLNGIYWPDVGRIAIRGRVGALIEVGAGFHPLLTGRENIYVNAAILGMSRAEVDSKLNDILEFAEIGDFIDAPVKHYSSGMFVRLGFAVAVHCQPDVLLIDEVLAVGDLNFVLKCYRKLNEFKKRGTTIIIISHNVQAIRNLCTRALWVEKGKIKEYGEVNHVCDVYEKYVLDNEKKDENSTLSNRLNYDAGTRISQVEFMGADHATRDAFNVGDPFIVRIHYRCDRTVENPIFTFSIMTPEGTIISSNYTNFDGHDIPSVNGEGYIDYMIDKLMFKPGKYLCSITFCEGNLGNVLEWHDKCYEFTIGRQGKDINYGMVNPFPTWSLSEKTDRITDGARSR